jgi:hypothetical protein
MSSEIFLGLWIRKISSKYRSVADNILCCLILYLHWQNAQETYSTDVIICRNTGLLLYAASTKQISPKQSDTCLNYCVKYHFCYFSAGFQINAEVRSEASHLNRNSVAFSPQANYTERPPLVGEVSANFCIYRCRVVNATDHPGR